MAGEGDEGGWERVEPVAGLLRAAIAALDVLLRGTGAVVPGHGSFANTGVSLRNRTFLRGSLRADEVDSGTGEDRCIDAPVLTAADADMLTAFLSDVGFCLGSESAADCVVPLMSPPAAVASPAVLSPPSPCLDSLEGLLSARLTAIAAADAAEVGEWGEADVGNRSGGGGSSSALSRARHEAVVKASAAAAAAAAAAMSVDATSSAGLAANTSTPSSSDGPPASAAATAAAAASACALEAKASVVAAAAAARALANSRLRVRLVEDILERCVPLLASPQLQHRRLSVEALARGVAVMVAVRDDAGEDGVEASLGADGRMAQRQAQRAAASGLTVRPPPAEGLGREKLLPLIHRVWPALVDRFEDRYSVRAECMQRGWRAGGRADGRAGG